MTATRKTTVVALSGSAETAGVLSVAVGFSRLVRTGLGALHVSEDGRQSGHQGLETRTAASSRHEHHGRAAERILEALAAPWAFGVVMGTRRVVAGPGRVGATATEVLGATTRPVLFVPPEVTNGKEFAPRRLIVPLDGSARTSGTYLRLESRFRPDANRETVVLYVLDGHTPRMLDQPEFDLPLWGDEFLHRHCPGEHRSFEWRAGNPASAVIELAGRVEGDLIVLCSGGDTDFGRGGIIQVLADTSVPVLVVPTPPRRAARRPSSTGVKRSAARH